MRDTITASAGGLLFGARKPSGQLSEKQADMMLIDGVLKAAAEIYEHLAQGTLNTVLARRLQARMEPLLRGPAGLLAGKDIHQGLILALGEYRSVITGSKPSKSVLFFHGSKSEDQYIEERTISDLMIRAAELDPSPINQAFVHLVVAQEYSVLTGNWKTSDRVEEYDVDYHYPCAEELMFLRQVNSYQDEIIEGITLHLMDSQDLFRGQDRSPVIRDFIEMADMFKLVHPDHPFVLFMNENFTGNARLHHVLSADHKETYCGKSVVDSSHISQDTWQGFAQRQCPVCKPFENIITPTGPGEWSETMLFLARGAELHESMRVEVEGAFPALVKNLDNPKAFVRIHKKLRKFQKQLIAEAFAEDILSVYCSREILEKLTRRAYTVKLPELSVKELAAIMSSYTNANDSSYQKFFKVSDAARDFVGDELDQTSMAS